MDLSLGLVGYLGFLFVLNGLGNVEGLGLPLLGLPFLLRPGLRRGLLFSPCDFGGSKEGPST